MISDAHGYPRLVRNALEHAAYRPGVDRLLYAGDLVDRGPEGRACLELVEQSGAEVLWGNHDVAVLIGQRVTPQDPRSWTLRPVFVERFHSGAWKLAACVDGVLVTHAGLSRVYQRDLGRCGGDPQRLADALNDEFQTAVSPAVRAADAALAAGPPGSGGEGARGRGAPDGAAERGGHGDRPATGGGGGVPLDAGGGGVPLDAGGGGVPLDAGPLWDAAEVPSVLDDLGPLWFRPSPHAPANLLQGVTQVCGHTPLDGAERRALEAVGVYLVEPTLVLGLTHDLGVTYRYAVIEGGAVRVEEGLAVGAPA